MAAPGENLRIDGGAALGLDHGDGEDRAGRGGGQQPPDPDRRRRRGAGAVQALVRRGGADAWASTRWARCSPAREGTEPDAPPVYVGSHLDTQPTGGKYDGVLGVLGALEVVRVAERPRRSGRGTRSSSSTGPTRRARASRRRCWRRACSPGVHELDWAYDADGRQGPAVRRRAGADRLEGRRAGRARGRCRRYFELHIEQGPILEAEGKEIGVVTGAQGLWWLQVTLTGKEAHTGSTPMPMRRNAGRGMAQITELVHADRDGAPARRGRGRSGMSTSIRTRAT